METNSAVFAATFANCMEGIEASDITIVSVTDVTEAARLRRLAASNVHMDYTVTYDLGTLGFTDAEEAYEYLLEGLNDALSGTHFRHYLAANIAAFNATSLEGARGGDIISSSYADVVDDDIPVEHHYREKPDTRNVIIGCVVGVVGFLIVGVTYALYHWHIHNTAEADVAATKNAAGFEAVNTRETELVPTPTPAAEEEAAVAAPPAAADAAPATAAAESS